MRAEISSTTGQVRIRYTVDGSSPTSTSGSVGNDHVFKASSSASSYGMSAISYKAGYAHSDVGLSASYTTLPVVNAPVFSPDGDTHLADSRTVSFSATSTTADAAVRYVLHSQAGTTRSTTVADLDGNNYLEVSGLMDVSSQSLTMSAWFKVSTSSADGRSLMGASTGEIRVELASGKPRLQSNECPNGCSAGDGSTAVQDGNWHHLMVVYGADFVKLYVDGTQEQSAAAVTASTITAIRLGSSWAAGNQCILAQTGKLDLTSHLTHLTLLAGLVMIWSRQLSPQMAQSVFSGEDSLALNVLEAAAMPWRGYQHMACQQNYDASTLTEGECKQLCLDQQGCQRGFSHRAADNECRVPSATTNDVQDCTASSLPRHMYYTFAGTHPKPNWRIELNGVWDNTAVTETSKHATGICTDCTSMPVVEWRSHTTLPARYVSSNNVRNSARSSGMSTTGWDYCDLVLAEAMSTTASTIAAWVRTDTSSPDWSEWWGAAPNALRLEMRPSGRPQVWSDGGDTGSRGQASSDSITAVRDGYWHHLAVTYGASTVDLYIDGIHVLSATALSATTFTTVRFGGSFDAYTVGVRATFSDIQLWRSELHSEQVRHAMDRDSSISTISHSTRLVTWTAASGVTTSAGEVQPNTDSLALTWSRGAISTDKFAYWRRRTVAAYSGIRAMKDGVQGVQFRCSGRASQHQCIGLSSDDPDQSCSSIDFALICQNGVLFVTESGVSRGLSTSKLSNCQLDSTHACVQGCLANTLPSTYSK